MTLPLRANEQATLNDDVLLLKKDALALARDIKTLENQVLEAKGEGVLSIFFSVEQNVLSSSSPLQLQLDNQTITHRKYSKKEIKNLSQSGGHRLFEAHIKPGRHTLLVSMHKNQIKYHFNQSGDPKVLHITLSMEKRKSLKFSIEEW